MLLLFRIEGNCILFMIGSCLNPCKPDCKCCWYEYWHHTILFRYVSTNDYNTTQVSTWITFLLKVQELNISYIQLKLSNENYTFSKSPLISSAGAYIWEGYPSIAGLYWRSFWILSGSVKLNLECCRNFLLAVLSWTVLVMSKGYSSLYPKLYVIFVMIFQHEFVQTMAWQHEVETNTKAIHFWNKYVNLYVVNGISITLQEI